MVESLLIFIGLFCLLILINLEEGLMANVILASIVGLWFIGMLIALICIAFPDPEPPICVIIEEDD